jgi:hypothetical protein
MERQEAPTLPHPDEINAAVYQNHSPDPSRTNSTAHLISTQVRGHSGVRVKAQGPVGNFLCSYAVQAGEHSVEKHSENQSEDEKKCMKIQSEDEKKMHENSIRRGKKIPSDDEKNMYENSIRRRKKMYENVIRR